MELHMDGLLPSFCGTDVITLATLQGMSDNDFRLHWHEERSNDESTTCAASHAAGTHDLCDGIFFSNLNLTQAGFWRLRRVRQLSQLHLIVLLAFEALLCLLVSLW